MQEKQLKRALLFILVHCIILSWGLIFTLANSVPVLQIVGVCLYAFGMVQIYIILYRLLRIIQKGQKEGDKL